MITSTTTDTLIAVTAVENCDDSLVPSASRPATNATISSASQSSVNEPRPTVAPVNPNTVLR